MKKPLVSICCITYNQERYIRDALEGFVMQQISFPFEIVISDDCSKDNTRVIIAEYKAKYPKIFRDVSPKTNLGVIENWKHVHQQAKGEYVAFCEGDDYWTDPLKVQKQVDFMEAHIKCGLCVTDFRYQMDMNREHLSKPAFASKDTFQPHTFLEHLKNAGYIGPMTWLYKRSLFMQNIKDYDNITDGTLALALDLFGSSEVAYLPDVTAVYRVHSDSAANPIVAAQKMKYIQGVRKTQCFMANKYGCSNEIKQKLIFQCYMTDMPLAIEVGDDIYIQNALNYFEQNGYIMKWFVSSCKEYISYKKQYEQVRSSKAYRLGKILLRPFSWIRRKCQR